MKNLEQLNSSCQNITGKPDVSLRAALDIYQSFYDYIDDDDSIKEIGKYLIQNDFTKTFDEYINKYIEFIIENDSNGKTKDIYNILNVSLTILINFSFSSDDICKIISTSNLMITFEKYLKDSSYFVKKLSDEKRFEVVYDMLSVIANLGVIKSHRLNIKENLLKIIQNISNLPGNMRVKMKFISLEVYFNYVRSDDAHRANEMADKLIINFVDEEIIDLLVKYINSDGCYDSDSKYFSKVELLQFICEIYKCGVPKLSKEQLENVKDSLKEDDEYKSEINALLASRDLANTSLTDKDSMKLNKRNLDENKFHVFLSYRHDDKTDVTKIYEELTQRGLKVWIDFKDMQYGKDPFDAMCDGIDNSSAFVCALSDSYQESDNCMRELIYAHSEKKKMFPFKVKPCELKKEVKRRVGNYNRPKLNDILTKPGFCDDIIKYCNSK